MLIPTGRANQHTQLPSCEGHTPEHGLGEVRIILESLEFAQIAT